MISIIAHGILGSSYRQEVVVNAGAQENGSLQVFYDIRRLLSMQYGDDTPMTGWALQPALAGMWLSRIERAFDINYDPAYIAISFLIPHGRRPKGSALLKLITDTLNENHSNYVRQSVIQGVVDWHFLDELSEALEAYLTLTGDLGPTMPYASNYGIAFTEEDIATLLGNLWDSRIAQCRIVVCGRNILTADKEFVALEDIPSMDLPDPIQNVSNDSKDLSITEDSDVQVDSDIADVSTIQEQINKPIIKDSPKKLTLKPIPFPRKTVFGIIGALVVLAGVVVVAALLHKSSKPKKTSSNTKSQIENNISTLDSSLTVIPKNSDKSFTVNGITFSMKYVEGGTFRMGSEDRDADEDESPVHEVTVSSFYIGETEVTQALWRAVMGNSVQQQRDNANASWPLRGEGDDYPMYYVSWNDCQAFVRELNRLTGEHFRLPTEAEWEYAARGGDKSGDSKYSGSNDIGDVAWYDGNSGKKTHTVKKKQPNTLGIYDMSGNVWEWCQDWYDKYTGLSETDPTGPASGTNCVLRGGGWYGETGHCRVSNRVPCALDYRYFNIGFRIVLE